MNEEEIAAALRSNVPSEHHYEPQTIEETIDTTQTPGSTPANLTSGATQSVFINAPLPKTWRLVYTIGGTTPSFSITGTYVNYTAL